MTKGTQLWPNDRMRAFFHAHIRRETALDEKAAAKLTEALVKAVNRMLVWEAPEISDAGAGAPPRATGKAKHKVATGKITAEPKPAGGKADAGDKPFDPYVFSAMVVLVKTGRDGLMKRLQDIKSAADLKVFAEAQHLAIDRNLAKLDELRKAIATAAERRLADRKAAAS